MVSTPERFASVYEQARRSGADLPEKPDYERMREFVQGEQYVIELSQGFYIKQLFHIVDIILPLLGQRLWSLLIAQDGFEFIVSDHPVALTWSRPRPPSFYGPGFGVPETDVTFPLSRRLALLGTFEGPADRRVASRNEIARINSRTCSYGERFVASSTEDLIWMMADGAIGNAQQLSQHIRGHRQQRRP
jgi:hypothetical protein